MRLRRHRLAFVFFVGALGLVSLTAASLWNALCGFYLRYATLNSESARIWY